MGDNGCGLRHDPRAWIASATGTAAARVRVTILGQGTDADRELLEGEIAKVLDKQQPDGSFGERTGSSGASLVRLLELGADPQRPEIQRGLDALLRQHADGLRPPAEDDDPAHAWAAAGVLPQEAIRALALAGRVDAAPVAEAVRWFAAHPETWLGQPYGCPWGPNWILQTLWIARDAGDVEPVVETGLRWLNRGVDDAGLLGHLDPWGTVQTAATLDGPEARQLAERLLPLVLRAQKPDGGWGGDGWGGHSVEAFAMLQRHGLLDALRDRKPLPADWIEVARVPAPPGNLRCLAWDGACLWTHDVDAGEAVGLSPANGSETGRIRLPAAKVHGLDWLGGRLAVCEGGAWEPVKNLHLVEADGTPVATHSLEAVSMAVGAAAVGDRLWIGDGFDFEAKVLDAAALAPLQRIKWPGTCCSDLTASPDGVWHVDSFAPLMIECDAIGQLLDWAEIPFYGATGGIAWDGERVWALDRGAGEICALERV